MMTILVSTQNSADPAQRLEELLDYVIQVTRLDEQPVFNFDGYRLPNGASFIFHQHDLHALPGVTHDTVDDDGPIWLSIQRLRRGQPPEPPTGTVDWLELSHDPDVQPKLRAYLLRTVSAAQKNEMVSNGEARPEDCLEAVGAAAKGMFDVRLRLEDRREVEEAAKLYIADAWLSWAEAERPIRKSIGVYQKFFELVQLKEISVDQPFEIVWGIGVSRWLKDRHKIDLPLIERLVEVEIDEDAGGQLLIRPRSLPAQINLRPYDELKLEGAALAQNAVRRAMETNDDDNGVSPFLPETFEPSLRACQNHLDVAAKYLPDLPAIAPSAPLPAADATLCVSNRWVLFARKRSDNFLLNDLVELKKSVRDSETELPDPAKTLVMGPTAESSQVWEPLGATIGNTSGEASSEKDESPLGDLFFPKPFNHEQVEIVRRLEKSDGVVVQGPPGTGKTHTISNIICHNLAIGRRVLVVSHGEPALAVLRDQLPAQVRDLAISITSSEREGLKQVESAARLIQSILQDLIPSEQLRRISDLEHAIIGMRERLQVIDEQICDIATVQLSLVPGKDQKPADLAKAVVEARHRREWFVDRPKIYSSDVEIADTEIAALRDARKRLGKRLEHIDVVIPATADLPDGASVANWHDNILLAKELSEAVAREDAIAIRITTPEALSHADTVSSALETLFEAQNRIEENLWLRPLADFLASWQRDTPIIPILRNFIEEGSEILARYYPFLERPIDAPESIYCNLAVTSIIERLANGQKGFGLFGFANRGLRSEIEQIRILNNPPATPGDWDYVRQNIRWRTDLNGMHRKWQGLSSELGCDPMDLTSPRNLSLLIDVLKAAVLNAHNALQLLEASLPQITLGVSQPSALWGDRVLLAKCREAVANARSAVRLSAVKAGIERTLALFDPEKDGRFGAAARRILETALGQPDVKADDICRTWDAIRSGIDDIAQRRSHFHAVRELAARIAEAGAPEWAREILSEPAQTDADPVIPVDWREAWDWAVSDGYLRSIDRREQLQLLSEERISLETSIAKSFETLVRERAFYALGSHMTGKVRSALMMFAAALRKIGLGTGKNAARHRRAAREAMANCYDAIPCWIMPSWRVAEQLPGALGTFDLVIMDEASQADIREVTTLLRGKKVLVVGDDKQVSPTAAFIETSKIDQLERGYLKNQPFRTLLLPGASLYDLAKVMFPDKFVMLREHFRCVEPIIRFSMQFYRPEPLVPLRVPTPLERLDPPLVDIYLPDGRRTGDKINHREAEVIVEEVRRIVDTPELARIEPLDRWRTIGVVSLIGNKQAHLVYKMLLSKLGEDVMLRHRISCGDSATFQGNEKDIIFLSMIADPKHKQSQTAAHFEQRFNVALSRARDRMVLVRSVRIDELKPNDLKAKVLRHFQDPMGSEIPPAAPHQANEAHGGTSALDVLLSRCDSDFEREIVRRLTALGYRVTPQVGAQGYRIDLVVEGTGDRRLAVECDGDKYHGPEKWAADMHRQRILERVGWRFWRCWASSFTLDPDGCIADLVNTLELHGVEAIGCSETPIKYVEQRTIERNSAQSISTSDDGYISDNKLYPGIGEGDRVVVRYLDTNKTATYTLTLGTSDEINGILSTTSPMGKALLGLAEEDEAEFEVGGSIRRIIVIRVESLSNKVT